MRDILLHIHIFKNAGTSVDWALKRHFGSRHMEFDKPIPGHTLTEDELHRLLLEQPKLMAVSTHQAELTVPFHHEFRVQRLIFLRHPIDRVGSVYSFNKRRTDLTPGSTMAKKLSLNGFVEWSLRNPFSSPIGDFQTRVCAGRRRVERLSPLVISDYERALSAISATSVVGVVEQLDESLVIAESALSPWFPGLDLTYLRQNVSTGRASDLASRLAEIKDALPPQTNAMLRARNQFDLALHQAATELLEHRKLTLPDFEQKLTEFRQRCSSHRVTG